MDKSVLGAIGAVAAVVVVALIARRSSKPDEMGVPAAGGVADGAPEPDLDPTDPSLPPIGDEEDEDEEFEVLAVTSDGYALVPDDYAVRLVPPPEEGEAWKAGMTGHNARGARALQMSWQAGEFTGARVVRGAADEGPWRFEALGRDGEYTAFVFETREGADAALKLFESRAVIRLGQDDETGADAPPSAEQFEEARRIYLETEAALDDELAGGTTDDPDHHER